MAKLFRKTKNNRAHLQDYLPEQQPPRIFVPGSETETGRARAHIPIGNKKYVSADVHTVGNGEKLFYTDENGWPPYEKHFYYETADDDGRRLVHDVMTRITLSTGKVEQGMVRRSYSLATGAAGTAAIENPPEFYPATIENFSLFSAAPAGGCVIEVSEMAFNTAATDHKLGDAYTDAWPGLTEEQKAQVKLVQTIGDLERKRAS